MRHLKWPLLLAIAACLSGCGTLLRTLLAPEQTVIGTAGDVANATNQGVTNALAPADVDSSATISDLDRIMTEHPDAANIGELTALKEQLKNNQANQITSQTQAKRKQERRQTELERATPDDRYQSTGAHGNDRRQNEEKPGLFSHAIRLGAKMPYQKRLRIDGLPLIGAETNQEHSYSNPFAEIRSYTLKPWQPRSYMLPIEARKGR